MPKRLSSVTLYLLALSAYSIALLALIPQQIPYYLAWNLFLAWLAFVLAKLFDRARHPAVEIGSGLLWLLFLPNTYYLVTDFIHINMPDALGLNYAMPQVAYETWRLVLIMAAFSVAGWLLGQFSLRMIHHRLNELLGEARAWAAIIVLVIVASFGLYIGRFVRLNSWDLIHPQTWGQIAQSIVDLLHNLSSPLAFICAFAGFILLTYLPLTRLDKHRSSLFK